MWIGIVDDWFTRQDEAAQISFMAFRDNQSVRYLKVLDAGFSQRNLGFDTDCGPVRAVVSEMPKDPNFLTSFFDFSSPCIIPPLFHTQLHRRRRYAVALAIQHIITSWSLNWWRGGFISDLSRKRPQKGE